MAGDNQAFEAQNASAGSDASITQVGGDRGIQSAQMEVDQSRSEPGQGLASHQDSFKKSDVVGMGFPDTQFADASGSESGKEDSHACSVEKGAKPFQSGTASIFNEVEPTADGGKNDPSKFTAAHKSLPLDSSACVTRPGETNGVEVRINDRGPYSGNRVLDMTPVSADRVGITSEKGLGKVDIHKKYTK